MHLTTSPPSEPPERSQHHGTPLPLSARPLPPCLLVISVAMAAPACLSVYPLVSAPHCLCVCPSLLCPHKLQCCWVAVVCSVKAAGEESP